MAIRELLIKEVYSKNMTNQQITKILEEIKSGVKVPGGTIEMVIGGLWNIHEKHRNNGEYAKADDIKNRIAQLKKIKLKQNETN